MEVYEKSEPRTPAPAPPTSGMQLAAQAEAEAKAVRHHRAKATDKTPGQDKKMPKVARKPQRARCRRRKRNTRKKIAKDLKKTTENSDSVPEEFLQALNLMQRKKDPEQDQEVLDNSVARP